MVPSSTATSFHDSGNSRSACFLVLAANDPCKLSKHVLFFLQLPEDIEWHFIGNLQSNKARALLGLYYCLFFFLECAGELCGVMAWVSFLLHSHLKKRLCSFLPVIQDIPSLIIVFLSYMLELIQNTTMLTLLKYTVDGQSTNRILIFHVQNLFLYAYQWSKFQKFDCELLFSCLC